MRNLKAVKCPISPIIAFGTKAETLERLAPLLHSARVMPQFRFTVQDWQTQSNKLLLEIQALGWLKTPLVVRSSALSEDTEGQSLAGHFCSVLDVEGKDNLEVAIQQVIQSYEHKVEQQQVFIQPMLQDVILSGVAFSMDPSTSSPYYVINYDDKSGSTTSVTNGKSNELHTFYCFRNSQSKIPSQMQRVIELIAELENLFQTNQIDIEFAIDKQENLYLLQCRPLTGVNKSQISPDNVFEKLSLIENKIKDLSQPHPYLLGSRSVFGVMPDWNPAEIIGIRPRPLSLSLYKTLVTDNIWAYQRNNYGYRNLRSFPLLVDFYGLPYIDVRVSFNSFVPDDLEPSLGQKLVDYYINRLISTPTLHDKVEFEILYTCYTLDLPERLTLLKKNGFTEDECNRISYSLRKLTNNIIHRDNGLWKKDTEKIKKLDTRLSMIKSSHLDKVSKIYWLLEDCKRYGTLPFAGLARAGFIAVQLLRSLVNAKILSSSDYNSFLNSLNTISSTMGRDLKILNKTAFLKKYGHLRPGTYDVLCPRYDEDPDRYFDWNQTETTNHENSNSFALGLEQLNQIESLLEKHKLDHKVLGFFDFIKSAIEGREYAKFVFSKSLSDAISLFKDLALENGFSLDDCSYANINIIKSMYSSSRDITQMLSRSIEEGRMNYTATQHINLPPLIIEPNDVWAFELPTCEPNYITQNKVTGQVTGADVEQKFLKDAIVFIPNADPGFDWLFSHNIKGLVTMYGGANSHMAIRAAELGIAAVIGAGETLYKQWSQAKLLEIDCNNRKVQVLK